MGVGVDRGRAAMEDLRRPLRLGRGPPAPGAEEVDELAVVGEEGKGKAGEGL